MIREFTRCLTLAAPQKNDENPTSFIEIPLGVDETVRSI